MDDKLFNSLTLEEKAKLFVGLNTWQIEKINNKNLFLSDGPHGIRKEIMKNGRVETVKAICYPSASLSACSFDKRLMEDLGSHLASECIKNKIDILLGPGINIKRSPLCGRNFEYFSEDPFLAGKLAAGYINGVQENKVGVSLKHFACNQMEYARFINDSIVDERTLREIYLKGFEIAIREAKPWTIMASYNKLNGIHTTENKHLLTEIGRNELGFDGVYMSDWGALENSVESIEAGLDLEMPGNSKGSSERIVEAIKEGRLAMEVLDSSTRRLLELYNKCNQEKYGDFDYKAGLEFAERVNLESIVLLKNDNNILPLKREDNISLIGDFALNPRYQGGGSSQINSIYVGNLYDELIADRIKFKYARGYIEDNIKPDIKLINEAVEAARNSDKVIIMAGLPRIIESEGYDRENLQMPASQLKLIDEVCKVNSNVIVILQNGAPVEMPFVSKVKGIIEAYLGGSMHSSAIKKILYGEANPSGRLAESFPLSLNDVVCKDTYKNNPFYQIYREGIFVGYRYYQSFNKEVLFPFGYGLSYSDVSYSELKLVRAKDKIKCQFKLKNNSDIATREVVQIYVGHNNSRVIRPKKELKGFDKLYLEPHLERSCEISIDINDLKYYDRRTSAWRLEEGSYRIYLAKNSNDEDNYLDIELQGDMIEPYKPSYYLDLNKEMSKLEYKEMLGYEPSLEHKIKPFTKESPISDLYHSFLGFIIFKPIAYFVVKSIKNKYDKKMYRLSIPYQPIRSIQMMSGFSKNQIDGLVEIFNHHPIKGFKLLKNNTKK